MGLLAQDEDIVRATIDEVKRAADERVQPLKEVEATLERELVALRSRAERLVQAVAEGTLPGDVTTVRDQLINFERRQDELRKKLQELRLQISKERPRIEVTEEAVRECFGRFAELWEGLEVPERRELVHAFVREVQYHGSRIKVKLHLAVELMEIQLRQGGEVGYGFEDGSPSCPKP